MPLIQLRRLILWIKSGNNIFKVDVFGIKLIIRMPNNAMVEEMNKLHFIDVSHLLSNQEANIDFYLFVAISNRMCVLSYGDLLIASEHQLNLM